LTGTKHGFGKRTLLKDYPVKHRGGKGVISIQQTERNGPVCAAEFVGDDDEVMLVTDAGMLIRTRVAEISLIGRNTQGVSLIRLGDDESLISIGVIEENNSENSDADTDQELHDGSVPEKTP